MGYKFIKETTLLQEGGQKLLIVMDGCRAHLQYRALNILKENNIIVARLTSHTSHVLQPLDVGVFRTV